MSRIFAIGDVHGCNSAPERIIFERIQIEKNLVDAHTTPMPLKYI